MGKVLAFAAIATAAVFTGGAALGYMGAYAGLGAGTAAAAAGGAGAALGSYGIAAAALGAGVGYMADQEVPEAPQVSKVPQLADKTTPQLAAQLDEFSPDDESIKRKRKGAKKKFKVELEQEAETGVTVDGTDKDVGVQI